MEGNGPKSALGAIPDSGNDPGDGTGAGAGTGPAV
jgi:hypothetical protein